MACWRPGKTFHKGARPDEAGINEALLSGVPESRDFSRGEVQIFLMLIFGVIGYYMIKHDYPVIATVLGIILGPIADKELLRTAQRFGGDWSIFFTRPISLVLLLLAVLGILLPFALQYLANRKEKVARC